MSLPSTITHSVYLLPSLNSRCLAFIFWVYLQYKKKIQNFYFWLPWVLSDVKMFFSLIYMNAVTADGLSPRLCQVGMEKPYWGCRIPWLLLSRSSGQSGHHAPDVCCCSHHCERPSSGHQLSCCCACPAMGVMDEETGRWWRFSSQLGRQGLLSSVLSLHIIRLCEETQLCCTHWLVTRRRQSLSPPGEPFPEDSRRWFLYISNTSCAGLGGCEFRGGLNDGGAHNGNGCWAIQI